MFPINVFIPSELNDITLHNFTNQFVLLVVQSLITSDNYVFLLSYCVVNFHTRYPHQIFTPDLFRYPTNTLHFIKILKPVGNVMTNRFNIQQLYVLPTPYWCVLYLCENKQHSLLRVALSWSIFITEMKGVYIAVRIGPLKQSALRLYKINQKIDIGHFLSLLKFINSFHYSRIVYSRYMDVRNFT
jgi:hypothetical protein